MSLILFMEIISPPSRPVVKLPKSIQSDQWHLHPRVGVSKGIFGVNAVVLPQFPSQQNTLIS